MHTTQKSTVKLEKLQPKSNSNGRAYGGDGKEIQKHEICKEFVQGKYIRYNEVTGHAELPNGDEVNDWTVNSWALEILDTYGENISVDTLNKYIFSNLTPRFHPVREYFDGLRGRLHENQLKQLISSLHFQNPDMRLFIEKWLCSIVAAAYGNVPDLVLVLIGPQGCGKTVFFERLLPDELSTYFATDKLDQGKDSDILMCQKLIILDDEFYGRSKKDAEHFKSLCSREKFTIRKPYGRIAEDHRRLAVLCGTSNKTTVINDSTGNRRIIPVEITGRDFAAFDAIDRDGLFANLIEFYDKLGEKSYRLSKQEMNYLNAVSDQYQLVNSERELIQMFVQPSTKEEYDGLSELQRQDQGVAFLPAAVIAGYIEERCKVRIDAKKIGTELTQLGFEVGTRRVNSTPVKGYYVRKGAPRFDQDEV